MKRSYTGIEALSPLPSCLGHCVTTFDTLLLLYRQFAHVIFDAYILHYHNGKSRFTPIRAWQTSDDQITAWSHGLAMTSMMGSSWCVALITLARWRAVSAPLLAADCMWLYRRVFVSCAVFQRSSVCITKRSLWAYCCLWLL